jgi:N-acyl homoserine lactone hydrolase
MIHAITTGYVRITKAWAAGRGKGLGRLINTLLDKEFSDWLPIWCFLIEHPDGLVLIDTGIRSNASDPIYFPPYMRLIQRAAQFQISREQEIDCQIAALGYSSKDIRYVITTHLHQDHDGGLGFFPNAEFIVSRAEYLAAKGLAGRMGGYLNHHWPDFFKPRLIDFTDGAFGNFPQSQTLLDGLMLVPTHGHTPGHLSVILEQQGKSYLFTGDAAYTEAALLAGTLDGISGDLAQAALAQERLRDYALSHHSLILPSHDPAVPARLQKA